MRGLKDLSFFPQSVGLLNGLVMLGDFGVCAELTLDDLGGGLCESTLGA